MFIQNKKISHEKIKFKNQTFEWRVRQIHYNEILETPHNDEKNVFN